MPTDTLIRCTEVRALITLCATEVRSLNTLYLSSKRTHSSLAAAGATRRLRRSPLRSVLSTFVEAAGAGTGSPVCGATFDDRVRLSPLLSAEGAGANSIFEGVAFVDATGTMGASAGALFLFFVASRGVTLPAAFLLPLSSAEKPLECSGDDPNPNRSVGVVDRVVLLAQRDAPLVDDDSLLIARAGE